MAQLPEGAGKIKRGIEESLRVVLHEIIGKMDLVTREEFDAQTKVLQRAEAQLKQLETKLTQLETVKPEKTTGTCTQ